MVNRRLGQHRVVLELRFPKRRAVVGHQQQFRYTGLEGAFLSNRSQARTLSRADGLQHRLETQLEFAAANHELQLAVDVVGRLLPRGGLEA